MNKIYKVVWSKARQCYVVASELARRSGKKSAAVLAVAACTMSIWGGANGTCSLHAFNLHERWGHVSV